MGDSALVPLNFYVIFPVSVIAGVTTRTKDPMDITGYLFAFALTKYLSGAYGMPVGSVVQAYPPIYWQEVLTPTQGITAIPITSAYTAGIQPGTYSYDLKWKSPSSVINTLLKGRFMVTPSPVGAF